MAAGGSITAFIVNYMLGGGHGLGEGTVTSSPVLPAATHPGLPLLKGIPHSREASR